jgi:hypothetical protein
MKMYGGAEVSLHALFTSARDGREWSATTVHASSPEEKGPRPDNIRKMFSYSLTNY